MTRLKVTKPPRKYNHLQFHWLYGERSSRPVKLPKKFEEERE